MSKGAKVLNVIFAVILVFIILLVGIKMLPVVRTAAEGISNITNESKTFFGLEALFGHHGEGFSYNCPSTNGFSTVCANEERSDSNGVSLLEKVGNCPYYSCCKSDFDMNNYVDDMIWDFGWKMANDCKELRNGEDLIAGTFGGYRPKTISLYDKCAYNNNRCKRDNKEVGQCLRLNFKGYYRSSAYIKYLCVRYGGGYRVSTPVVNLFVFKCTGACSDDGTGWKFVDKITSKKGFDTIKINDNVKMIDICPAYGSAPHKIGWVSFTTSQNLVKKNYGPCDSNNDYDKYCSENLPGGGAVCIDPQNGLEDGKYSYVLDCSYDSTRDCVSGTFKYNCPGLCNRDGTDCARNVQNIPCFSRDDCNKRISYIKYYPERIVLQNDITTTGNGIVIDRKGTEEEGGIEFDCNGHKISGKSSGAVNIIGIKVTNSTSVDVRNCKISGFNDKCILIKNSTTFVINNDISDCQNYGILVFNQNVPGESEIDSNNVKGTRYGIQVINSNAGLDKNIVCGNSVYDISCMGSYRITDYHTNVFDTTYDMNTHSECSNILPEVSCNPQDYSFCANPYVEKEKCKCTGTSGCEGDTKIDSNCGDAECETGCYSSWDNSNSLCLYADEPFGIEKECCNYYSPSIDKYLYLGQCAKVKIYDSPYGISMIKNVEVRGASNPGGSNGDVAVFACYQTDYDLNNCSERCAGDNCDGYSRYIDDITLLNGNTETVSGDKFSGGYMGNKLVRYIEICPYPSTQGVKVDWVKVTVTK